MTPVGQTSPLACQVKPNHDPKPSLLDLAWDRRPSLLESQTQAFQRFTVNHYTPYTYTAETIVFPVNYCTPCTYLKSSARLKLNYCVHYTYITDCARCVINPRQSLNPQYPYRTPKTPTNPPPASLRGDRPSKSTLNSTPSHIATAPRPTSSSVTNQNPQHPPRGSNAHLIKPPVHLEFR